MFYKIGGRIAKEGCIVGDREFCPERSNKVKQAARRVLLSISGNILAALRRELSGFMSFAVEVMNSARLRYDKPGIYDVKQDLTNLPCLRMPGPSIRTAIP